MIPYFSECNKKTAVLRQFDHQDPVIAGRQGLFFPDIAHFCGERLKAECGRRKPESQVVQHGAVEYTDPAVLTIAADSVRTADVCVILTVNTASACPV